MAGIFSSIIQGEIPSHKIAENKYAFSFLDIKPIAKGHALVIPKLEVDYIFDLPEQHFIELQLFSAKIARAIKKAVPCIKVGTCVIGLEVPHAHIHLVPMNTISDMNFSLPRLEFSQEEYQQLASEIAKNLAD